MGRKKKPINEQDMIKWVKCEKINGTRKRIFTERKKYSERLTLLIKDISNLNEIMRSTGKNKVGSLRMLTDSISPKTSSSWKTKYCRIYPNERYPEMTGKQLLRKAKQDLFTEYVRREEKKHGHKLQDKEYPYIKKAISIFIDDIMFLKTFKDVKCEEIVLYSVAEICECKYISCNDKDDSEGADGKILGNKISIKPKSCRKKTLPITFYYEIKGEGIYVENMTLKAKDLKRIQ